MVFLTALAHILEFLIVAFFLNELFSCTAKRKIPMLAAGAAMCLAAFFVFVHFDSVLMNIAVCTVIYFVFAKLYFDCGVNGALLSSLFFTALNTASEFLTMSLLAVFSGRDITVYRSNVYMYLIMVLVSRITFIAFAKAAVHMGLYLRGEKERVPLHLLIYPIAAIAVLYTFWVVSIHYELSQGMSVTISAVSIAVTVSVLLTFVFYGRTSRRMNEMFKAQRETERLQADQTYYALLDRQNEELKTVMHDEKNHLTAIKALANDPAVDEYIDRIYGEIKYHSMFGNTKNRYLDLMFNKYTSMCDSEGIATDFSAATANLSFMEPPDMITFVSNVLDNAIDAAKKSKKRQIKLSVKKVNGAQVFTCRNSCEHKPRVIEKILKTTKSSPGFHGLGVKSVKTIVEKYGGDFDWEYDDGRQEFCVTAIFFHRQDKNQYEKVD